MEKTSRCREIVETAFSKNIPDWNSLSPFDPMRVLADSLVESFADIDDAVNKGLERFLDRFPAFLGFPAKEARAPQGYFEFIPQEDLDRSTPVQERAPIFFTYGKQQWNIVPIRPFSLYPIKVETINQSLNQPSNEKGTLVAKIKIEGELNQFEFHFVPSSESIAQSYRLHEIQIEANIESKSKEKANSPLKQIPIQWMHIKVDHSSWNSVQSIQIAPAPEKAEWFKKVKFLKVIFKFKDRLAPKGVFQSNLAECTVSQIRNQRLLEPVKGIPWEEFKLPEDLIGSPSLVDLILPGQDSIPLQRICGSELNEKREGNPHGFYSYIYDPYHHKIILPFGFEILGRYKGGCYLSLGLHHYFPETDWLPDDAQPLIPSGYLQVESIRPAVLSSKRVNRENPYLYHQRFFQAIHGFWKNPEKQMALPEELANLPSIIQLKNKNLDYVETTQASHQRSFHVYVLGHGLFESAGTAVPQRIKKEIEEVLMEIVPVGWEYKILPFEIVPTTIAFQLRVHGNCFRDNDQKARFESKLRTIARKEIHLLCRKRETTSLEITDLLTELIQKIEGEFITHSGSQESNSVRLEKMTLWDGMSGQLLSRFTKQSGKLVDPKLHFIWTDPWRTSEQDPKTNELNSNLRGIHEK